MVDVGPAARAAVRFVVSDPNSPSARTAVASYFTEIGQRFGYHAVGGPDAETALLAPPTGRFLLAFPDFDLLPAGAALTGSPDVADGSGLPGVVDLSGLPGTGDVPAIDVVDGGDTDGEPVACGGVRTIGDGVGEIKRMWVHGGWRGAGVGYRLLRQLEDAARDLGHHTVRLDTHETLTEALALYERAGYERVGRYNDNPFATHFFQRALRDAPEPRDAP